MMKRRRMTRRKRMNPFLYDDRQFVGSGVGVAVDWPWSWSAS